MTPMTPLGALIGECKARFTDEHGVELTYGDIARRSRHALNRQRVQQLAQNPIKALPSPDVLRGLALGLGVPYSVVLQRALESAGYLTAPLAYTEESTSAAIEAERAAEHARNESLAEAESNGVVTDVAGDR